MENHKEVPINSAITINSEAKLGLIDRAGFEIFNWVKKLGVAKATPLMLLGKS